MQLDILGSAGSYPGPENPCSSYLVRTQATSLLLDLGNGAMTNLFRLLEPQTLDGIIISHGHIDHFADMIGLYHYLKFAKQPLAPIEIYGTNDFYSNFNSLVGDSRNEMASIFTFKKISNDLLANIGDLDIHFLKAWHPIETYIVRVRSATKTLCYGADGDISDNLLKASYGSDLLVCESTWERKYPKYPPGLHMDAKDVATVATQAEVHKVLITHIAHPGDSERILRIVKNNFPGEATLARPGLHMEI